VQGSRCAFSSQNEGSNVLGCPIGTPDFCDSIILSSIREVETDLNHLRNFPHIHQRIKSAIYSCNARIVFLLRAVQVAGSVPGMREYDQLFDNFMAHTLTFENNYTHSPPAQAYSSALQQSRLSIKEPWYHQRSHDSPSCPSCGRAVALREF
jgi:hypothetical protein